MKNKRRTEWLRLDNAAKVFPAVTDEKDTKVFRVACELREEIKKEYLEQALQQNLKEFPVFQSVLRRGLFWYYLELTNRQPVVSEENRPPCSPIYDRNKRGLLFAVSYYGRRINLEVHHALTDGTGAVIFLNRLVIHYLQLRHGVKVSEQEIEFDLDTSIQQRSDDSFYRYYDETSKKRLISDVTSPTVRAFRLKGPKLKEHRIKVVEGHMSATEVKKLAKQYNTTVTVYLTALLLSSIGEMMTVRDRKHPVGIMVPVNLRSYFKSNSVRNFFGTIDVFYDFGKNSGEFTDIITAVEKCFKNELTKEKMEERVNHIGAMENNLLMRMVPLVIKDFVIKRVYKRSDAKYTFAISNVGKISMPDKIAEWIKLYSVFVSTEKKQVCVCSYQDQLVVSFTSPLIGTQVECNFFRKLTDAGLKVEIVATSGWEE